MGSDAGDLIAIGKSKPKITIHPHRDREGLAASPNGEALGVRRCVARRQRLGGGEPTQSASTMRPRVNLCPSVWRKAANIARADSVQ
jgi:hypothetical protein